MGRAPASRPSGRWRPSSAIALAAAWLLLVSGFGRAREAPARSVLVFPVRSHWLSAPLAEAVTGALSRELTEAGLGATAVSPDAPMVRLAVSEGWLGREEVAEDELEGSRNVLAVAAGAAASLTGELSEGEREVSLRLGLTGAVSQREASFEVKCPRDGGPKEVAGELARRAAAALTDEVWAEAGADEGGAREAALARHAAGQAAMAEAMYRDAVVEFEAAVMAEPDSAEYLWGAAKARVGSGDLDGALVRLRHLARRAPEILEVKLLLGDVALMAGKPEQAEAAFLAAEELHPSQPEVIEGLARAARAREEFDRAERYYAKLLPRVGVLIPGRGSVDPVTGRIVLKPRTVGEPDFHDRLVSALAHQPDDAVRLAGVPREDLDRQLARVWLRAGNAEAGIGRLVEYHQEPDRPAYSKEEYVEMAPALDEESEEIARKAQMVFAALGVGQLDDERADSALEALHRRSDRLGTLAERMRASQWLEPAHRYRVLAYNLLNESNFEALMYLRTGDAERRRRADLLRGASRIARGQACELGEALLGVEGRE